MWINPDLIRTGYVLLCFILLFILFVVKEQNAALNWSIFFSMLWVTCSLGLVNYYCVALNLWQFTDVSIPKIGMPYDLFFMWIIGWSVVPVYVFKGKYALVISLVILLLDLVFMPFAEELGFLKLNKHWIIGEIALIILVWLPGYLWASSFYTKTYLAYRAVLQVVIMGFILLVCIPAVTISFEHGTFNLWTSSGYWKQFLLILAFPSLVAVHNLVKFGKGTPFPYDKTEHLVQRGVYAYCKNPIQWSFTALFIPLSINYSSYLLACGALISIFYVIGTANYQEREDMAKRFGKSWTEYARYVPSWYFLWKPKTIPVGTMYFKYNCNECEQIMKWFKKQDTVNLDIKYAHEFESEHLLQVTYKDHLGNTYKSSNAIALALEHINLAYATLGWFMQLPGISWFIQTIVDALGFGPDEEVCSIK